LETGVFAAFGDLLVHRYTATTSDYSVPRYVLSKFVQNEYARGYREATNTQSS